jgi:hypothetical protein
LSNSWPDVHDELGTARSIKQFVFKRQRTSTPSSADPIRFTAPYTGPQPLDRAPSVKVSQPGDELREQNNGAFVQPQTAASQAAKKQADIHLKDPTLSKNRIDTSAQPSEGTRPVLKPSTEIRRFHMSRSAIPATLQNQGGPLNTWKSTKAPVAIFHERKQQTAKPLPLENLQRKPSALFERRDGEIKTKREISNPLEGLRPVADFKDKNRFGAPLRNVLLPSGETMPWNASNERLDAEMQAYTLDQIARNIEQNAKSHPSTPLTPKSTNFAVSSSPSRFKPKAPALRYHERHPEDSPAPATSARHANQDITESMDVDEDDGDYVIETYIRVPVEHVTLDEDPKNVGLLVLDSQPDIDEFYNDDSDSDSEIYDEEEDENGNIPAFLSHFHIFFWRPAFSFPSSPCTLSHPFYPSPTFLKHRTYISHSGKSPFNRLPGRRYGLGRRI